MRTPHYITRIKRTSIPGTHAVIDTEARQVKRAGMTTHQWACGASSVIVDNGDGFAPGAPSVWRTQESMWDHITSLHARVGGKLHVWAHNMAYDLRISGALEWLPRRGYDLAAISLANVGTWASWRAEHGEIVFCDSYAWLPVPLDTLALDMGFERPKFNYRSCSDQALMQRCADDVDIAALAISRVLQFLRDEDLGSFRPTGAAQCHVAWRRRFMTDRSVLVHDDAVALQRERTAMHTGRTEAWRWGHVRGPVTELDMSLAYCRIAAENALPSVLKFKQGAITNSRYQQLAKQYAVLADVTVETEEPLVPVTVNDRTLWPVGTFQTTLWDPEIDLLLEQGAKVQIHGCWCYERSYCMRDMSRWLIDRLDAPRDTSSAPVQRMLKHWARALVGRCALRYRTWEHWGTCPNPRVETRLFYDDETGASEELLQVGSEIKWLADLTESTSSCPQITGWVMSKCRVLLWHLMTGVGLDRVLYCDTDGVLVDIGRPGRPDPMEMQVDDVPVRVKAVYDDAVLHGPRNIEVGGDRRLSGIPRTAVRTAPMVFDGEVWASLEGSLSTKHPESVRVSKRKWKVKPVDNRREHVDNGLTAAYRMEQDEGV